MSLFALTYIFISLSKFKTVLIKTCEFIFNITYTDTAAGVNKPYYEHCICMATSTVNDPPNHLLDFLPSCHLAEVTEASVPPPPPDFKTDSPLRQLNYLTHSCPWINHLD